MEQEILVLQKEQMYLQQLFEKNQKILELIQRCIELENQLKENDLEAE